MKTVLSWVLIVISLGFAILVNTSYIETGGKFIDFSRWKTLTFWVQILVNTFLLTQIYAMRLRKKKDDLIKENGHIAELYQSLFTSKDDIINTNKKEQLNIYLSVHTNLVEKLELYIYKLEKQLRRAIRHSRKVEIAEQHEKYEKYLSAVKLLDFDLVQKSEVDPHSIPTKARKISFDTLFDLVDYKSSRPISISYSDTRETAKKIAKSPLGSFVTMFLAIVAFGNILVMSDDWRSMALITLTLIFSGIIKYAMAEEHAKEIATNKSRSLEKAVDTVKMFSILSATDLDKMTSILLNDNTTESEQETEQDTNTFDILKPLSAQ